MACDIVSAQKQARSWDVDDMRTYYPELRKQTARHIRGLVVDDDGSVLKYVAHMLTTIGFKGVETAQKRPEVMKRLTARPYDLMVTDLEMPDINGFHLAQKIKKEARDTKVIIMTGRPEGDCFEMMASRWVDGWLFKPFGMEELRNMLQWLGLLKC